MCTLIALWKWHPAADLVMALNRDESFARPAEGIHLWPEERGRGPIVAGRDLRSGGTWFGVGRRVAAGLTNHRGGAPPKPDARSRGSIVVAALGSDSVERFDRDWLAPQPAADFAPFHLLACDGAVMRWMTNAEGRMESREVEPGAHVLGNLGLDDEQDPLVLYLQEALIGIELMDRTAADSRLRELLAEEGPGRPLVRGKRYGTRSSAILWRGCDRPSLHVTDGPPDASPWLDRSELLRSLRRFEA